METKKYVTEISFHHPLKCGANLPIMSKNVKVWIKLELFEQKMSENPHNLRTSPESSPGDVAYLINPLIVKQSSTLFAKKPF